jgi:hypothetical protein
MMMLILLASRLPVHLPIAAVAVVSVAFGLAAIGAKPALETRTPFLAVHVVEFTLAAVVVAFLTPPGLPKHFLSRLLMHAIFFRPNPIGDGNAYDASEGRLL